MRSARAVAALVMVPAAAGIIVTLLSAGGSDEARRPAGMATISATAAQAASPPAAATTPAQAAEAGDRIVVPALHIDLPLVAGDGYDAPLDMAAVYPGRAWPGAAGRAIVYAHDRPGMFATLSQARAGQAVEIVRPGASQIRYTVSDYFPSWPISDTRWLEPSALDELVLITCTTYDYNDPRQVVVAMRDSP